MTRREFAARLAGLGAAAVVGGTGLLTACGGPRTMTTSYYATGPLQPLKAAAATANILFGAAASVTQLQNDNDFTGQINTHCALLVSGNELKWDYTEPWPGAFDFSRGDWMADYAAQHGMAFRGHTLVSQIADQPSWVASGVDRATALEQLTSHIKGVAGHYAGRIHSWDVVNEAIEPSDRQINDLRNTPWMRAIGPEYIDVAFHAAAEADPKAMLVYNDYGLEPDTDESERRRDSVIGLLQRLKGAGVPIHALGMQGHLLGTGFPYSPDKLRTFIREVGQIGLKVIITEMDVNDQGLPADDEARDAGVADTYAQFLEPVLQEPAVTSIVTWGLSDRYTWLSGFAPRRDGLPARPLPLDSQLQPKQALWAMLDAFKSRG